MIILFLLNIAHFAAGRWRKFNMPEAFTVSALIDALCELEKQGHGDLEVVNYEGFNLYEVVVEQQYDGNVVVIQ